MVRPHVIRTAPLQKAQECGPDLHQSSKSIAVAAHARSLNRAGVGAPSFREVAKGWVQRNNVIQRKFPKRCAESTSHNFSAHKRVARPVVFGVTFAGTILAWMRVWRSIYNGQTKNEIHLDCENSRRIGLWCLFHWCPAEALRAGS